MTLVIAEKPSMARAIQAALGSKSPYRITAARGHLLELETPDAYLPDSVPKNSKGRKVWRAQDLPIIPSRWKRVVSHGDGIPALVRSLLGEIKATNHIIHAGDPDREGQLLIDEILEHAGFAGRVDRVWLASLDEQSIKKAFAAIKPNADYKGMRDAADARGKADWLVGMNMTRAWTIKSGVLTSVGRVQTPTLALVVARDREIENFVPKDYFQVLAQMKGAWTAVFAPVGPDGKSPPDSPAFDADGRLIDRATAERVAAAVTGKPGTVLSFTEKERSQAAPLPFNLSSLQKAASARAGLSAKATLDAAQALYDAGITSYPRTDCQFLPEEQHGDARRILANLPVPADLCRQVDPARKHRAWNTAKVTAHHAIIPTGVKPGSLSSDQAVVWDLVWKHYCAMFLPDARIRGRNAVLDIAGYRFTATSSALLAPGWKALLGNGREDDEDDTGLPLLEKGQAVHCETARVVNKQTEPPPRFTEGTLIEAMSKVHLFVTDESARARLKETSGIGTEATRANILETLFKRGYLENLPGKKKAKAIQSTRAGRSLIDLVHPDMTDPVTTALWEDRFLEIEAGKLSVDGFLADIEQFVRMQIEHADKSVAGATGAAQEPCVVDGCKGHIRRMKSKKAKGVFFWVCSERDAHPLISDEKGRPGKPFEDAPRIPCTVDDCPGQIRRLESKKSPGVFFWACTEKSHDLLRDDDGRPGRPFGAPDPGDPACPVKSCKGRVRRLESKKKKGVFFWACTEKNHGLIKDENGKPGAPFDT